MEEQIIIRNAKNEDFERVHELIMQVHKLHVKERSDVYKNVDPLRFEEFKEELLKSDSIYLVAEIEDKVVGICFSQIKEICNNKIMKDKRVLHINEICVDKNLQKRGIGKKLYNQIVQIAKEKNIDNIELMVWGFNKEAIKFYEKLGMNVKNMRFEQKIQ